MSQAQIDHLQNLTTTKNALIAQVSEVNDKIHALAQEMIPEYAKHQVGQEIEARQRHYRISRIIAVGKQRQDGTVTLYFEYYGHEILKGGGLHKTERHLYWLAW